MNQPADKPKSAKASQIKALLFFGLALVVVIVALSSGYLLRGEMHKRAGNVLVEVRNEADLKLRVDLFLNEQVGSIDGMDKGERGTIRFSPKVAGPVLLRVYHNERLLKSLEEGEFAPSVARHLRFTVVTPDEIRIEYLDVEGG